jgi:hypothetical protein
MTSSKLAIFGDRPASARLIPFSSHAIGSGCRIGLSIGLAGTVRKAHIASDAGRPSEGCPLKVAPKALRIYAVVRSEKFSQFTLVQTTF